MLLPAGPNGSSRVAILGGLDAEPAGTLDAAVTRRSSTRAPPLRPGGATTPSCRRSTAGATTSTWCCFLTARSPRWAVRPATAPRAARHPRSTATRAACQELKRIELLSPGAGAWRLGPPQRKWRTYHSSALLLPDGRVLSAGDDYWDLADQPDPYIRQGPTAGKPLDEAEIYEPPYLFDGEARAPRPAIDGGPATASWGDDVGVPVSEAAGRPAGRAVLVAPGAVTHGVDMNQRHVELSVLGRVAGKGLNVRMPASPNVAPPGWYMLFVLDAAGTPSVARWVQLRAGRPGRPDARSRRAVAAWRLSSAPAAPGASTRAAPRASVRRVAWAARLESYG